MRKPLDPHTLRSVGRELISLAEAFYQAPRYLDTEKDKVRGDILSTWGRIYLRRAGRAEYAERKSRAIEAKRKKAGKR